jgi:hypothetical protein
MRQSYAWRGYAWRITWQADYNKWLLCAFAKGVGNKEKKLSPIRPD